MQKYRRYLYTYQLEIFIHYMYVDTYVVYHTMYDT